MSDTPEYHSGKKKCKARRKSGKPCGNYPVHGHLVCRLHGAASPKAKARVAREQAEAAAVSLLQRKLGRTVVGNPLEELQKLAGEVVAWKDILREQVDKLQQHYRYGTELSEQIRGEVLLFERALDRCASVLGLIAKLNIDHRLAKIEEAKVTILLEAVTETLDEIGLPVEEQLTAKASLARRLRSVV